jgi:hypothetical protein
MPREEKRARGGVAISSRFRPAYRRYASAATLPRGVSRLGYRSTLGLLEYGLAGRAIITIAIASPANNDKTSILLTHLRARSFSINFQQRAILKSILLFSLFTGSPNRTCQSLCVRAAARASVYEVTQERCGKPKRSRCESSRVGFFPCVVCDALLTGSRTRERCMPG